MCLAKNVDSHRDTRTWGSLFLLTICTGQFSKKEKGMSPGPGHFLAKKSLHNLCWANHPRSTLCLKQMHRWPSGSPQLPLFCISDSTSGGVSLGSSHVAPPTEVPAATLPSRASEWICWPWEPDNCQRLDLTPSLSSLAVKFPTGLVD